VGIQALCNIGGGPSAGYYESSTWESLPANTQKTLSLPLGAIDFGYVGDIGFESRFHGAAGGGYDFHTSVVPIPTSVLLGLLGLTAAGLGLRRLA